MCHLARRDVDVNEHETLSNITLKAYNIKVNEQCFYYSSTLHSHSSMHVIILIYGSMKGGYYRGCHAGIFSLSLVLCFTGM